MIRTAHLSKTYPNGKKALQDITLEVERGIVGVLGPNGAGKTTFLRILGTLIRPTQGDAHINGLSIRNRRNYPQIRRLIGYLPQGDGVFARLTVEQNLDYFALLRRITDRVERSRQIGQALEATNLQGVRAELAQSLSGGLRRRLGIAIALLGKPPLLIVDEPTSGLDPSERIHFRNVIADLAAERTILLSTHIAEDVQQVGKDLVVISEGTLLYHGSVIDFVRRAESFVWAVRQDELAALNSTDFLLLGAQLRGTELVQRIIAAQQPGANAVRVEPTLEDAYLFAIHNAQRCGDSAFSQV